MNRFPYFPIQSWLYKYNIWFVYSLVRMQSKSECSLSKSQESLKYVFFFSNYIIFILQIKQKYITIMYNYKIVYKHSEVIVKLLKDFPDFLQIFPDFLWFSLTNLKKIFFLLTFTDGTNPVFDVYICLNHDDLNITKIKRHDDKTRYQW